jgi:hypothetical protein
MGGFTASGPGQYLPDPTEGITKPEDLPQAKIARRSSNFVSLMMLKTPFVSLFDDSSPASLPRLRR